MAGSRGKQLVIGLLCGGLLMAAAGCGSHTVTGFGSSTGHLSGLEPADSLPDEFGEGYASFAVSLLQEEYTAQKREDVFLSPASAAISTGLVLEGAAGDTQLQLLRLLGAADKEEYAAGCRALQSLLTGNPRHYFHLASSMWIRNDWEEAVLPGFIERNETYYGALLKAAPFDDTLIPLINDWVSENTDGRIDKLLEPPLDANLAMLLGNALSFDGKWEDAFPKEDTKDGLFHASSGDVTLPMMTRTKDGPLYKGDGVTAALLPYQDERTAMLVALPDGELGELVETLTAERISGWLDNMADCRLQITMPRFSMTYEADLSETYRALGVTDAFDSGRADFSALVDVSKVPEGLYVSDVMHKTTLEVDEEGTRAAAVHFFGLAPKSAMPPYEPLVLDRPFLCAIVDRPTGALLFLGTVSNPTAL